MGLLSRVFGGSGRTGLGGTLGGADLGFAKLRARMGAGAAVRPQILPPDPWPGDAARGSSLITGTFIALGKETPFGQGGWRPADAGPELLALLHDFTWLRDLDAAGDARAVGVARAAVADWLANEGRLGSAVAKTVTRPDVVARRIAMLLSWFPRLTQDDEALERRLLTSLTVQAAVLARSAPSAPPGLPSLTAVYGLIVWEACLPAQGRVGEKRRERALRLFDQLLAEQIQADGGHIERSPAVQLDLLRLLVDARAMLILGRMPVSDRLQQSIDRVAPVVRFFCHGDGGFALFNDTNELDPAVIEHVLTQAEANGKAPRSLPHIGFERLQAKKTLAIFETGAPSAIDTHAHASTLSLEVSIGRERLITNCGAHVSEGTPWRRVQRATAAHSTLGVEDSNSSEIIGGGQLGRRAQVVQHSRDENEFGIWVEAQHDGYQQSFGVVYQRRLFLAASGEDLRGEEALIGAGRGRFTLRFHLHPKVQTSVAQDGQAVFLRLPGGTGWRLRVSGGKVSLADSIYLGQAGQMRRSQQVVIQGEIQGAETRVKWALQREGGPKR